jgi:hypothetical protein
MKTMDWRCGSSRKSPALQSQSPEFKPQSHQKKKKKRKKEKYENKLGVVGHACNPSYLGS